MPDEAAPGSRIHTIRCCRITHSTRNFHDWNVPTRYTCDVADCDGDSPAAAVGKYWWPKRAQDIQRYCDSCECCQLVGPKLPRNRPHAVGVLQSMEMYAMDYIGPITPESNRAHKYIIIGADYMSRFCHGPPNRDRSSGGHFPVHEG